MSAMLSRNIERQVASVPVVRSSCLGGAASFNFMTKCIAGRRDARHRSVSIRKRDGRDTVPAIGVLWTRSGGYCRNSLLSSPMPAIATVTLLTGPFMVPTPSEVPQQMMSPGSSVMSWEIRLTSSWALKIMSTIG